MLRILRVEKNKVNSDITDYAHLSSKWCDEIYRKTEINLQTVFAQPVVDGDYVNFVTSYMGKFEELNSDRQNLYADALSDHQKKVSKIISYLGSAAKFADPELNASKELLLRILGTLDKKYVFDNKNVLAVPLYLHKAQAIPPVIAHTPAFPFKKSLLGLLLLIPLSLLVWFLLNRLNAEEPVTPVSAEETEEETEKPQDTQLKENCILAANTATIYPQLVIAMDSSSSMLESDGRTNKLSVAKDAAKTLIKNIYPKIDINFIEINGCPSAKNRGYFKNEKRAELSSLIDGLQPSGDSGTPLVDAIREISNSVDGVNSDAVGILITDGMDSCEIMNTLSNNPVMKQCKVVFAPDMNLKNSCQVTYPSYALMLSDLSDGSCVLSGEGSSMVMFISSC